MALRLSAGQALEGAVREHERKRRQEAEAAGEKVGKHQAPQMPLALLVALERQVGDENLPLFFRAYALYRLLRH